MVAVAVRSLAGGAAEVGGVALVVAVEADFPGAGGGQDRCRSGVDFASEVGEDDDVGVGA